MPKIQKLEICGFRAFGEVQTLDFQSNLALIWGFNSQGKTSVAEALEFLLTGTNIRRELLGGAKSEYEGSLRNVHLPATAPVWIKAQIVDDLGAPYEVCRTLVRDYTADSECVSNLTVDGTSVTDLSSLGITLSDPPLRAPVLLQHSLRFALSCRPQDRADYFKALLEIQDLEHLRSLIESQVDQFRPQPREVIQKLHKLSQLDELSHLPRDIENSDLTSATLEGHLRRAVASGLSILGEAPDGQANLADLGIALTQGLNARRESSFPVAAYGVGPTLRGPESATFLKLREYESLVTEVDAELESLRAVFEAVLAIPAVTATDKPIGCPVCETPDALTPARIAAIRDQVAEAKGLRAAQAAARVEIEACERSIGDLDSAMTGLIPVAASLNKEEIAKRESDVTGLIGDATTHRDVMTKFGNLGAACIPLKAKTEELRVALVGAKQAIGRAEAVSSDDLAALVEDVRRGVRDVAEPRTHSEKAAKELVEPIRAVVDKRQGLEHWRTLTEIATDPNPLLDALRSERARSVVRKQLEDTVEEVDQAKVKVFDDKFEQMSTEIARWWELLRPDEPVQFDKVRRRGMGRRFVAFKARLRPYAGAPGVERDVLGVFSDSQLNALGLSAFLARASLQASPVVVLDDPLQAGDSAHRATFVADALQELLNEGTQVIILSFDDTTQKLVQHRYEHLPVDGFVVTLANPKDGAIIAKASNTAEAFLQDAAAYLGSDLTQMRRVCANKLRTAAERIAKEILVKEREAAGDTASLDDYEGKTLGPLIIDLVPYLHDPSHKGKWRNANTLTTPGSHDDAPPDRNDLRVAYGDLRRFYKDYLAT